MAVRQRRIRIPSLPETLHTLTASREGEQSGAGPQSIEDRPDCCVLRRERKRQQPGADLAAGLLL